MREITRCCCLLYLERKESKTIKNSLMGSKRTKDKMYFGDFFKSVSSGKITCWLVHRKEKTQLFFQQRCSNARKYVNRQHKKNQGIATNVESEKKYYFVNLKKRNGSSFVDIYICYN